VKIRLNGEPRELEGGTSVAALLAALDIDARKVAVEHNRRVVRRDDYAVATIGDGDEVEIVNFVGGG
jgi:thiamine biosynthesis protein ThiS